MIRKMIRAFSSVDASEVTRFSVYDWWNPNDILHPFADVRIAFIKERLGVKGNLPFKGLKVLDVGCGGGILCERFARLGGEVTGIDPTAEAIEIAKSHLPDYLKVNYINTEVEEINGKFDLVVSSEVIEHVNDPFVFLEHISRVAQNNVFLSTVARTWESYLVGIVMVEHVLGFLDVGTHDWYKFINKDELENMCRQVGLNPMHITGWTLDPLKWKAREIQDLSTGYMLWANKSNTEV